MNVFRGAVEQFRSPAVQEAGSSGARQFRSEAVQEPGGPGAAVPVSR